MLASLRRPVVAARGVRMPARGLAGKILDPRRRATRFVPAPQSRQFKKAGLKAPRLFETVTLPRKVQIVEVGPRDGLQNEPGHLSTATKVELIERIARAGVTTIEAGSFVSKSRVPQMADTGQVLDKIQRMVGVQYPVLTPTLRYYREAVQHHAPEVAVFGAVSNTFSLRNINCTREQSLENFRPILEAAIGDGIPVRGYVSTVLGCPYEGFVDPKEVAAYTRALYDLGCYQVSLGDTIGTGSPGTTYLMLKEVLKVVPADFLAVHFHDTYGMACANVLTALQMGIGVVDASIGGLGGCPFAGGSTGNVATEEIVYMLDNLDIRTGIDMDLLVDTSNWICQQLGRPNSSRVSAALTKKRLADPPTRTSESEKDAPSIDGLGVGSLSPG